MHYYQHHIGDFIKSTANLTHEERSIYLQLIWKYYDTEKPLPDDIESLAFDVGARDKESTIRSLLKRFFVYDNDMKSYKHERIEAEISKYHAKSDRAKSALASRWSKNDIKSDIKSDMKSYTDHIPTINQEPRTNNQEPNIIGNLPATVENKQLAKARSPKGSRLSKDWVLPKDWGNWALEKGLPRDKVILEAEKFRNYWTSKSGSGATKVDWMATWHNWILKACEDFGSENKTFAERTQDFKNKQAEEFYAAGIGSASEETLRKLRLIP